MVYQCKLCMENLVNVNDIPKYVGRGKAPIIKKQKLIPKKGLYEPYNDPGLNFWTIVCANLSLLIKMKKDDVGHEQRRYIYRTMATIKIPDNEMLHTKGHDSACKSIINSLSFLRMINVNGLIKLNEK